MSKVKMAPAFTSMDSIYPGPHVDEDGLEDTRVWFHIPVDIDVVENYVTYIIFPYGGTADEIKEVTVSATDSWLG